MEKFRGIEEVLIKIGRMETAEGYSGVYIINYPQNVHSVPFVNS